MSEEPEGRDGRYDVTSTDMHGGASHEEVRAKSVTDLVEDLRSSGLQVSSVTGPRARRGFEPRKADLEDFAFFNEELANACRSGMPLPGALRSLSRDMSGRRMRRAIAEVAEDVERGVDFAEALGSRAHVFPPGYVAMVSAGLKAGDLAGALLLISEEARFSADLRHRVLNAVAYPLVVILAGSFFLAFVGWSVMPAFADMFREMEIPLPYMTKLHIVYMTPLLKWAPLVVIGALVAVWLLWLLRAVSPGGRRVLDRALLWIPIVGRLVRAIAVARFCRTLATALRANVPVLEAVTLAGYASGNTAAQDAAAKLGGQVAEGGSVSDGLAEAVNVFPATVVWMVHIGEQRGRLAPALEECARLQEARARRAGEFLPFFLATAMTAAAAAIILEGALAMFLPFIKFMEGIG